MSGHFLVDNEGAKEAMNAVIGGTISVYCNGELPSTCTNVGAVIPSDLYLGIGMCPDTGWIL